jgi:hypothetical protein
LAGFQQEGIAMLLLCTAVGICTLQPLPPKKPPQIVHVYAAEHYQRNSWPYNPHPDFQLEGTHR